MKKTALSIILALVCACATFVGFGKNGGSVSNTETVRAAAETSSSISNNPNFIDYAGQATLDLNADSQTLENVTVKAFIDGDTTHFNVTGWGSDNIFKARYAAVNTPESTGTIEPWGKKAAEYTKNALKTATSIVLESDTDEWKADSTGTRYMTWVWYKAPGSSVYRNLNLELLQEGLALGSKAGESRYGELATPAIAQAKSLDGDVHSQRQDPNFFYGKSIELTLKELRLNIKYYDGKRVAFEGIVAAYVNQGVYVESYDEETEMYYGIYVYYGFNFNGASVLTVGNKVRISAVVSYYEAGQSYQVSSLTYNKYKPGADDVQFLEKGYAAANVETSPATYTKKVEVETTDPETQVTSTKTYNYTDLALNTSISMKGLYVEKAYTTDNGGDNDGAMTLTCKKDGKMIKVRTIVLRHPETKEMLTQEMLVGKTIDVTGIIDTFSGESQIKILSLGGIKLTDGSSLFPPVVEPEPPVTSSPDEGEQSGCGSVIALSAMLPAILPALAAAFVFMKKNEK